MAIKDVRHDPTRQPEDVVTRGAPEDQTAVGKNSDDRTRKPVPAENPSLQSPRGTGHSPAMRGEPNLKDEGGNTDRNV